MPIRRQYYGWLEDERFFLSRLPPDAPVRPSTTLDSVDDVKALLQRRGVEIFWWPPLPDRIHAEIQNSLRLD